MDIITMYSQPIINDVLEDKSEGKKMELCHYLDQMFSYMEY